MNYNHWLIQCGYLERDSAHLRNQKPKGCSPVDEFCFRDLAASRFVEGDMFEKVLKFCNFYELVY